MPASMVWLICCCLAAAAMRCARFCLTSVHLLGCRAVGREPGGHGQHGDRCLEKAARGRVLTVARLGRCAALHPLSCPCRRYPGHSHHLVLSQGILSMCLSHRAPASTNVRQLHRGWCVVAAGYTGGTHGTRTKLQAYVSG
jgi:hypothetical protein